MVLLVAGLGALAGGQSKAGEQSAALTNSDVVRMVKAGISERTIELEIKDSPNRFDTSPRALIRLKRMRVSEKIIDAMMVASQAKIMGASAVAAPADAADTKPLTGDEMVAKALDAMGPHEKLIGIHAVRWTASATQSSAGGDLPGETARFVEEGVREYPGLAYMGVQQASGRWEKVVVTPEFGYRDSREMTIALPEARAEQYREEMKFDPVYIAQHMSDYIFTALGSEHPKDAGEVDVVRISAGGMNYTWKIDAKTGRLIEAKHELPTGEVTVDYSDYRPVDGLVVPFGRKTTSSSGVTELRIGSYKVNPDVDGAMFLEPSSLSTAALSLRVLQSESVSYSQGLDGWNSANCQLTASPGTSNFPSTLDDVAFTKGRPGGNLKLICNSWEKNSIMPRILNAMLVVSSDGNAYVIACDKAWHWSKCAPLDVGKTFHGSRRENKFDVDAFNENGKEVDAHYTILLTKPLG
jgi:hypothetical protein